MQKISVVLTSYNHGQYIREAIDSVLAQTYSNFELIIWDDGSTDDSWLIINSYRDSRIKAYRNEVNRKRVLARAIAECAFGEYIAVHHSDDIWEPKKLEKQVAFLESHPDIGAVFTNAKIIDEGSADFADTSHFYHSIFDQPNRSRHEWLNFFFYHGNALCHPSVLFRRRCYVEAGGYRYGFAQLTDFDMWIRFCLNYEIHVLPEKLVRFRVRNNEANASGNRPDSRIRGRTEFYRVISNYLEISSFDEFVKVFPQAKKFQRDGGFIVGFVLAMLSLEPNTLHMVKTFGVLTLSELISEEENSRKLLELYDFDHQDFIEIAGMYDIFSMESVGRLNEMLSDRDAQKSSICHAALDGKAQTISPAGSKAFFTICAKNFLAHARVLRNSVKAHYPDTRFFVVLCDRVDDYFDPAQEDFEFIYLEELNLPNLNGMSERYNITEFNTAVKPFAFLHLMAKCGFESVIYLDPDLFFVDRMNELETLMADGAEAVLTPHILQPAEYGEVRDRSMLQFGIYNLGFLALKDTPSVRTFLSWWGRRLEHDCVIQIEQGLFVDQKWADLLPAFVQGTRILHHPGYNVAYWNLSQREVIRRGGSWFVNDQPLRFVHFSGNNIDDTTVFSRHSQQVTVESIGDLRHLLDYYREQVFSQGHQFYRKLPYAYNWNGSAGINLHTPKELDMAKQPESVEGTATNAHFKNGGGFHLVDKVRLSFRLLRTASHILGGLYPLLKKTIHVYRQGGISAIRQKVRNIKHYVEASPEFYVPASSSPSTSRTQHIDFAPRLLFIDWSTPRTDRDAGSITAFRLLEIYVNLGYAVTFIPNDLQYLGAYTEAVRALGVQCLYRPDVVSIEDHLKTEGKEYDFVLLCRAPIAGLYIDLIRKFSPESKIILNTSDLHYLREAREAEIEGSSEKIALAQRSKKEELNIISRCDVTIVMSRVELEILREELPDAEICFIPLMFVDVVPDVPPFESREHFLFIGGFPHRPNVDAVLHFCEEIFPKIRFHLPQVEFHIVGNQPPPEVLALGEIPGVIVHGYVKDLSDIFTRIRVSVAPLRYGAGIKGKIGTSLSHGVPVVATSIAAEGMDIRDGEHVVVADDPQKFADLFVQVYTNENLWRKISASGHEQMLQTYSLAAGQRRIDQMMRSINSKAQHISIFPVRSFSEYRLLSSALKPDIAQRSKVEISLIKPDEPSFSVDGFCAVCGKESTFNVSFMYSYESTDDGKPVPNWREHLDCIQCGMTNRLRASMHYFHAWVRPFPDAVIYITEQTTSLFRWLKARHPATIGSEYFGDAVASGVERNGIRNEDLTALSFPSDSIDYVLSFDVMEHVSDDVAALKEVFRCLKPGGVFLFTAPFDKGRETKLIRAKLKEDNTIEHLLPPEYHGNPVDEKNGALCFRYFAWDLLDDMREVGFVDPHVVCYWSRDFAYLGIEQFLFVGRKPK